MPISKRQMKNAITRIASNDDNDLIVEALMEIISAKFNSGNQSDWDATHMLKNLCARKHKDVDRQAQDNGNMTIHIVSSREVERKKHTVHKYFRQWHS